MNIFKSIGLDFNNLLDVDSYIINNNLNITINLVIFTFGNKINDKL